MSPPGAPTAPLTPLPLLLGIPVDADRWRTRYTTLALEQLSGGLPYSVADAAYQLIEGDLSANPYRVSKALTGDLTGLRSAHAGRDHRILLFLDEDAAELTVVDIDRRSRVYRQRSPIGWWRDNRRRRGRTRG